MRLVLVVNNTASSVTARNRVTIQRVLAAHHKLEVAETSRRGHAARLARAAALDGVDVVAVLAGDGTLNEAADGLVGTATALAPLPGGSTNVFAHSIGIDRDPVIAAHRLVASLARLSFRRIGVGNANGRRFLFHVGIGFDAAVIRQVERRAFLKRIAAHPAYVVAAFDTWFRHYDRARTRFEISVDDTVVAESPFAIVSNQSPYTYLGSRPLVVAPGAGLDQPLALTAFRTISIPALIPAAGSAIVGGDLVMRSPHIVQREQLAALTISSDRPYPWQVDGDYLGDVERLEVRYEPEALTIVMPTL
jgi:diacylglycerol kinase family enzyme